VNRTTLEALLRVSSLDLVALTRVPGFPVHLRSWRAMGPGYPVFPQPFLHVTVTLLYFRWIVTGPGADPGSAGAARDEMRVDVVSAMRASSWSGKGSSWL
jgi:hypothetical protein